MTEILTSNSEKRYFFDTYAIIELIKINQNYIRFKEEPLLTSILNYGEFYYWYLKNKDKTSSIEWLSRLKNELLALEIQDVTEGMKIRFGNIKRKISFVDAVGYAMALRRNLIFLTGDVGFKGLPNVEFVK